MNYTVNPGLCRVGNPDDASPALVTANYKMSFDRLRKELSGLDAWIMVLDTKGINVWCAAGKGTFGTEEAVRKIGEVGLRMWSPIQVYKYFSVQLMTIFVPIGMYLTSHTESSTDTLIHPCDLGDPSWASLTVLS